MPPYVKVFPVAGTLVSDDVFERARARNSEAVELYANGNLLAYIPAGLNSTIDVPKIMLHVSIRRKGGGVLFEQTLDIPKNAVISYVVQPSGAVIASGEEIDPNDYDDDDYYYDRDGRRRRR